MANSSLKKKHKVFSEILTEKLWLKSIGEVMTKFARSLFDFCGELQIILSTDKTVYSATFSLLADFYAKLHSAYEIFIFSWDIQGRQTKNVSFYVIQSNPMQWLNLQN